jgi:uncharacterized RDD family membrane protein YckC
MPICDNCGTGLPVGYEYCFQCGYPVRGLPADATDAGAAAQQPPQGFAPPSPQGFAPPAFTPAAQGFGVVPPPPGMPGLGAAAPVAARAQVLAGWGVRLIAALIDYMLVSLVLGFVAFFWFAGMWGGSQNVLSHLVGANSSSTPMLELEALIVGGFFVYNLVCESLFHATVGKRVLGLRVVAHGGGPAGFAALLVRNLMKAASCVFPIVGVPLAVVTIAVDPNRQRFGDRLAHTYVLRDVVTFVAPSAPR